MKAALAKLLLPLIGFVPVAIASAVTIVVHETTIEHLPEVAGRKQLKPVDREIAFTVDTHELRATPTEALRGARLPSIARYSVKDHQLCDGSQPILPADHILCQCHTGAENLVVIATAKTSLNPLYWPAALLSHPVQLSEVWALVSEGAGPPKKIRMIGGSRAEYWTAVAFEPAPVQSSQPAALGSRSLP